MTKEQQRRVIEEAALAKSSKDVGSVVHQLDSDKIEGEKRKLNVVVLNVPEHLETASSGQKNKLDTDFCRVKLGMDSEDFDK